MDRGSLQLSLFQNDNLLGQSVAISGRLSIPRREAIDLVLYSHGTYRSTVSSLTTMLVVGKIRSTAPDGLTKKIRAANLLNAADPGRIQIIGQGEFYRLLDSG